MAKKDYTTIEVDMFRDILCKRPVNDKKHTVRLYPNGKAQVENPFGAVFGMAKMGGKNTLNFEAQRNAGLSKRFIYSIVVEGEKAYFITERNILNVVPK